MTEPYLPAATDSEPGLLGRASYDRLVRENTERYTKGSSNFVDIYVERPVDPRLIAQRDAAMTGFMGSDLSNTLALFAIIVGGFGAFVALGREWLALAAALALFTAASVVSARIGIRKEDQRTRAVRQIKEARTATVLAPVGEAYRRLASAAHEVEDDEREHSREAIASVRLAHQGAREIVTLLHEHHAAGTTGSTSARSMTVEIYRLASEVDAYLSLHDANTRFAPGEDQALTILSETSQLTFAPREIEQ